MIPRPVSAALALAAAALVAACAEPTPGERVSALRAGYQAELNGFIVEEEPVAAPDAAAVEEAAAAAPEPAPEEPEGAAEAAETAAEPDVRQNVRQDVLLDILIRNDNDDRLPGLTLDVEQVDADKNVKTSYRIYVDTSGIAPGTERAVSYTLRDVDYAPGDGFAVEVRQAIPPEMIDQYRELSDAGEPS